MESLVYGNNGLVRAAKIKFSNGLFMTRPIVKFYPLDISDEDSINDVLTQIDMAIQYGEDLEPKEPKVRNTSQTHCMRSCL